MSCRQPPEPLPADRRRGARRVASGGLSRVCPGLFEPTETNGSHFFTGAYQLHHPFQAAHKLLLQGAGRRNWVSDNFGRDWEAVPSPGTLPRLGPWLTLGLRV